MTSITCGNCKGTHSSVAIVKACHVGEALLPCEAKAIATGKVQAHVERMASASQISYLNAMLADRPMYMDVNNYWPENMTSEKLTMAQASKLITEVKAEPKEAKAAKAAQAELEDGMYVDGNGTILKVYHTVHGANVQVAKVLVITQVSTEPVKYEGEWDYRGTKAVRGLTPAMKLSEAEAKVLGILYGFCVRCAKTLTLEQSQHVGYGKRCAGHEGWFYPTKAELKAMTAKVEA